MLLCNYSDAERVRWHLELTFGFFFLKSGSKPTTQLGFLSKLERNQPLQMGLASETGWVRIQFHRFASLGKWHLELTFDVLHMNDTFVK